MQSDNSSFLDSSFPDAVEEARLRAVNRYRGLGADLDGVYGQIAVLAARLFGVSMAKVTLVDRDNIWLLASHGLDGVDRIHRGDGLCELVVTGDVAHLVDDALQNPSAADRAFLRRHNVRFYACAPIVNAEGYRLGTVTVMDTAPQTASSKQLGMLEDLAGVVAKQLEVAWSLRDSLESERRIRGVVETDRDQARLDLDLAELGRRDAIREREIAERDRDLVEEYAATLQSTLVPPSLPNIDGVALAKYYLPASPRQVGGDFYDVFPISQDQWGFFLGDVVGHGAGAAVATSLVRYTLRSAAWHYDDPALGLTELNAVMRGELTSHKHCTVITGTMRPHPNGEGLYITVATGGHQPALLIDPEWAVAHEVRPTSGMMVGAMRNPEFCTCSLWLKPGQTLLLFTDGIIEARRGDEKFDIDNLAAFVAQRAHLSVNELISDLTTLTAKLEPTDDVAIVAIQVPDTR